VTNARCRFGKLGPIDARLGSINNVTRTHCPLFAALSKTGPGWEMVAAGEIMEQQRDKVFFS